MALTCNKAAFYFNGPYDGKHWVPPHWNRTSVSYSWSQYMDQTIYWMTLKHNLLRTWPIFPFPPESHACWDLYQCLTSDDWIIPCSDCRGRRPAARVITTAPPWRPFKKRESVLNSLKRSSVRTLPLPATRGYRVATAARCNGTCIEKRNGDCVIRAQVRGRWQFSRAVVWRACLLSACSQWQ